MAAFGFYARLSVLSISCCRTRTTYEFWCDTVCNHAGSKSFQTISYTCELFFSKMLETFRLQKTWKSEYLPTSSEGCQSFRKTSEDHRRFPTTSENFPITSKDNSRCRKIFDDFKTGRANDLQRISNQSRALLKSSEDVVTTSRTLLSIYTRYCYLAWEIGLNAWDHNFRSAGVRLTHNAWELAGIL